MRPDTRGNNGDLYHDTSSGPYDSGPTMAAATSPSITALSGGGFETVLVGTDGNLEAGTSSGTVYPAAAVSTGTSPSIA